MHLYRICLVKVHLFWLYSVLSQCKLLILYRKYCIWPLNGASSHSTFFFFFLLKALSKIVCYLLLMFFLLISMGLGGHFIFKGGFQILLLPPTTMGKIQQQLVGRSVGTAGTQCRSGNTSSPVQTVEYRPCIPWSLRHHFRIKTGTGKLEVML